MSYFVALKKILDNTAFVVLTELPATMMNKTKVHVLLPGILEITGHLGLQCGLSVKRIPTSCLVKVLWHSSSQSYPWGCGLADRDLEFMNSSIVDIF